MIKADTVSAIPKAKSNSARYSQWFERIFLCLSQSFRHFCCLDYRMNRTIIYSVNVVTNRATQRILLQS